MQLELRPLIHFTKAEAKVIEDARHTMYEGGGRGPRVTNKWSDYLDGWSLGGTARQRHDLFGTKRALQCELELQEWAWADTKKSFKQYPHWRNDNWGHRDRLPEDYRRRVITIRRAIRIIDKAIAMAPDEAINRPPHRPIPRAVMKRVRAAMAAA
jgi:hypothetical protein